MESGGRPTPSLLTAKSAVSTGRAQNRLMGGLIDSPKYIHEREEKKMEIKVLGPGCPKCESTAKNVKEAVALSGVDASVDKVTDVMEIAKYGVFGTPAVVIDGEQRLSILFYTADGLPLDVKGVLGL